MLVCALSFLIAQGAPFMATGDEGAKDSTRREISPSDPEGYVDQFWSGMFATLCSFGQAESRLVWMRWSAFLVVHVLILSFLRDIKDNQSFVYLVLGVSGLALSGIWAYLNHLGWVNQNVFYWYAARLNFKDKSQDIMLPTDEFAAGKQPGKPGGEG